MKLVSSRPFSQKERQNNDYLALILAIIVAFFLLLWITNFDLPYEQDEGSKAAQILLVLQNNSIGQPTAVSDIYREFEFSGYYLLSSIGYKIIGGDIYAYLNGQSLFFGALFFAAIMLLARHVYGASPWLTLLIFASIPIILITFTYGNEVALSLSLFTLSLWLTLSKEKWRYIGAVFLLTLAIFTRIDVVLWLPFWFAWTTYYAEPIGWHQNKRKQVGITAVTLLVFILAFWIIFIRELPPQNFSFEYHTNIKLLIGFLTFPFNLSILLIGGSAFIWLLYRHWQEWGIYLWLTLPLLFYILNLSSPKYIISLAFLFGLPSVWLLQQLQPLYKTALISLILIWWFVSITPYGLKGPTDGAFWYLPTDDGPAPTGAYFAFFQNAHSGFYQERYLPEIEGVADAIQYMSQNDEDALLLGRFNPHFYNLELVSRQLWAEKSQYPWVISQLPSETNDHIIMMQRSYLHLGFLEEPTKSKIRNWLENGQITAVSSDKNSPFPSLIQLGDNLSAGTDTALGQRILFMADYYGGHKTIPSTRYIPAYRSLCWLHIEEYNGLTPARYQDNDFVAVAADIPNCIIFNATMPYIYYGEADPRPGNW